MRGLVRVVLIVITLSGALLAQRTPESIDESRYIRAGGIDQWIQIRGDDLRNPVLLWVNGGPGASTMVDAPAYRSWQRQFTVVMWDQRGEGKTFEKNGESGSGAMTIEQMSSDGIEVAQFLRKDLHKEKIILLGHSWGSILGIHMIKSRPDLFVAYVGTGQVTRLPRQFEAAYPLLCARAKPGSQAEQELAALGAPPWKDAAAYDTVNKWGLAFDPPPAPPTEEDRRTWMSRPRPEAPAYIQAGVKFSQRMLSQAMAQEDLPAFATRFAVPVIFIQGANDLVTTTSEVRAYFNQIVSRNKRFIELPGAGHDAIFRNRNQFFTELVSQVRPLAIKTDQ